MKLELHVHTKYSKDSFLCFLPLYLKCRLLHIDYIAITEHNNIEGALQFQKYCKLHGDKVHVIVGEEIYTQDGEIIGLFLSKNIVPGKAAVETISDIKSQNGIVLVPHPYDEKRAKTVLKECVIAENRELIDCVEVYNGRNSSLHYGNKQLEIGDRYGIPHVIGSDAHTWMEIGRNYMVVDAQVDSPEHFKGVIETAKFHKKSCIRSAHVVTKFVKAVKLMRKGKFDELYRIVIRKFKKGVH